MKQNPLPDITLNQELTGDVQLCNELLRDVVMTVQQSTIRIDKIVQGDALKYMFADETLRDFLDNDGPLGVTNTDYSYLIVIMDLINEFYGRIVPMLIKAFEDANSNDQHRDVIKALVTVLDRDKANIYQKLAHVQRQLSIIEGHYS